jgi:hypothetical protein
VAAVFKTAASNLVASAGSTVRVRPGAYRARHADGEMMAVVTVRNHCLEAPRGGPGVVPLSFPAGLPGLLWGHWRRGERGGRG